MYIYYVDEMGEFSVSLCIEGEKVSSQKWSVAA